MAIVSGIRSIGKRVVNAIWRTGYGARFFVMTLLYSGMSFRRFRLTVREIFFSGVMSLIIILVAGMFVGMVLGLQGYETLQSYGSESALGVLVALSLVRELGPVVAGLLFASRAGSAITAEIGLMNPAAGVIATSPTTMPVAAPIAVAFFVRDRSRSVQTARVAIGASIVFANASAAVRFAASALPPLNPNHPSHNNPAPSSVNGTFCGRIAWRA